MGGFICGIDAATEEHEGYKAKKRRKAIRDMVGKGYEPSVYKSANIDGGPEYNYILENRYADRIWHK